MRFTITYVEQDIIQCWTNIDYLQKVYKEIVKL